MGSIKKAMKSMVALLLLSLIVDASLLNPIARAASEPVSVDFPIVNDFYADNRGNYPNGDQLFNPKSGNWVGSSADPAYGEAQAALRFDISDLPEDASISSARLKIYVNDVLGSPDLLTVWGSYEEEWDDERETVISKDERLIDLEGAIEADQWIMIPITGFVQSRLAADKPVSLVLTGNPTGDASFNIDSKESTDSDQYGPANPPELSVTYSIKSTQADLAGLTLSSGNLTPEFDAEVTDYSASVANEVTSVTITPAAADNTASVTVNGIPVANGSSAAVNLHVGNNPITIISIAEDGVTRKTYALTIVRALSGNADLSSLLLDQGTLNEAFDPNLTAYTTNVPYALDQIKIIPTIADAAASAKVRVGADEYASDEFIPLDVGANPIQVTVTAQDGSTKSYTLTVNRSAASTNASLDSLMLADAVLMPNFASGVLSYSTSVDYSMDELKVTASIADSKSSLQIQGNTATSGNAVTVPIQVGGNIVNVLVTAEDGITQINYSVSVEREGPSANARLSQLLMDQGALSPSFDSDRLNYSANVGNGITSLNMTPTAEDGEASLKVNGQAATSGNAVNIPLHVGDNPITISVTAEDTSVRTYTVLVTRLSNNADLSSLLIDQGELSPVFSASNTDYTASVDHSVDSLHMTPTLSEDTATLTVNGNDSTSGSKIPVPLSVGPNAINVIVKAQDGTERTYTVTVTRAAAASSDADLIGLSLSGAMLNPSFAPAATSYTSSVAHNVSSITVTPTVSDRNTTVEVNGVAVTSGTESTAIPLNVGSNTVTVVATAQDGTTMKTYTLTVNRAQAPHNPPPPSSPALPSPHNGKVISQNGQLSLPAGGTGEVSLGDAIKIDIPAQATDKELKLTIEKVLDTQRLLTNEDVLASPVFEILKNFSENFSKPVTLTFTFDLNSLNGNQKPVVFYYDEVKKEWVEVGGKASGDQIAVEVDHFTKYAVFAVDQAKEEPAKDPAMNISDIAGHWAEAAIKQAVSIGLVEGYADGTFKPGKTVTRAEFAVMLMNVLKPQEAGAEPAFTDTAKIGAWARKAVTQAVHAGIIKGYDDGSFRPDAEITRAEMAVMIAKMLKLSTESTAATGFADDNTIPSWAKGSVAILEKLSLMEGTGTNRFNPNSQATRAEAVTVLLKMIEQQKQVEK